MTLWKKPVRKFMANLPKQILAEKENVEKALDNLEDALARPKKSVVELSAIATFLHNIYNGIENILKQALKIKNISSYQYTFSNSHHVDLTVPSTLVLKSQIGYW